MNRTREKVLFLDPTASDKQVCVAAGYIIAKPLTKVYFGWKSNPAHFLDFHADNVKASNYSNLVAVVKAAKSKFSAGNHGNRGAWIVDQHVNKESAAELVKYSGTFPRSGPISTPVVSRGQASRVDNAGRHRVRHALLCA